VLVADDQVHLTRAGGRVLASSPETIRGKLEVRGIGIVSVKSVPECELVLVADLVAPEEVERLPAEDLKTSLVGIELPLLRLAPFETSAAIKLALAVAHARRS
jgi:serine kinase of HPr protein (carbohydrate metabolism regulator)